MPLSAREVDRLGERIKAGPLTEDDRRRLLEFRASFLPAYVEVIAGIRDALGIDPSGRPEKKEKPDEAWLERLKLAADSFDRVEREESSLEQFRRSIDTMEHAELTAYRRGQFTAIMMVSPYIRELSE